MNRTVLKVAACVLSALLLLQGCAGIPVPVDAQVYAAPAATATPDAARTPEAAPTDAPVAEEAVHNPSAAVTDAAQVDVNSHCASDGTEIYYIAADGVRRMNADGNADGPTGIQGCSEFIALNPNALYYLACDETYVPTIAEQGWGTCPAFDLMLYRRDTGKTERLLPHVLNACAYMGSIYAVDHTNHAHIVRYGMGMQTFSDVTAFPAAADATDWVDIRAAVGGVVLDCSIAGESVTLAVAGDTIGTEAADLPDGDETAGQSFKTDSLTGQVSLWTGSRWQALPLSGVNDVTPFEAATFILAADPRDKSALALYKAGVDGTVQKVAGPVDITGCTLVLDEIAGGWYFAFSLKDGGGPVSGVLLKYRIA